MEMAGRGSMRSASPPERSEVNVEATHRLQQSAGNAAVAGLMASLQRRADVTVQRDKTAEQLDADYKAAVVTGQWGPAAENLNGFDDAGIRSRVALLNHDQLIWLYTAALATMSGVSQTRILTPIAAKDRDAAFQPLIRTGHQDLALVLLGPLSDADIAAHVAALTSDQLNRLLAAVPVESARVRSVLLDVKWKAAVPANQWSVAADALNGFSDADIIIRLKALTIDQILALRAGATTFARLKPLIEIGSKSFTNTTDTGNAYTSNALMLRNGVLITKDVKFVSTGTFGAGRFDALENRVIAAVTAYMTGKYKLRVGPPGSGPTTGDADYPITVRVVPNASASYAINLHGGQSGRSAMTASAGDVFEKGQGAETSVPDIVLAHESGHMVLGASDEYANASVPGRAITNDHSLMGNFYNQGIAAAELKDRNMQFLVTLAATWFPGRTISIVK